LLVRYGKSFSFRSGWNFSQDWRSIISYADGNVWDIPNIASSITFL
jgi:hypothetical protein